MKKGTGYDGSWARVATKREISPDRELAAKSSHGDHRADNGRVRVYPHAWKPKDFQLA
jgi:hypothetical protein